MKRFFAKQEGGFRSEESTLSVNFNIYSYKCLMKYDIMYFFPVSVLP